MSERTANVVRAERAKCVGDLVFEARLSGDPYLRALAGRVQELDQELGERVIAEAKEFNADFRALLNHAKEVADRAERVLRRPTDLRAPHEEMDV